MKRINSCKHKKNQRQPVVTLFSGICLALVWLFLLSALTARTDLITLGQFYLYHAKDQIRASSAALPEGSGAYEVMMEEGILPADSVERFFEAGGKVVVTDKTEKAESLQALSASGYTMQGQYESDTNTITVKQGSGKETYAHELGHVADNTYGPLSSREDFHALVDKYGRKYSSYKKATLDYGIAVYWENDMYNEMFAEMFADTCLYPQTMQRMFPEVYEYMKDLPDEKI